MANELEDSSPAEGRDQKKDGLKRFNRLPAELKRMILNNIKSDNLRETARDIGSFRQTSKENNEFVNRTSSVNDVRTRIMELRSIAKELWDNVLKDGLSPYKSVKIDFLQKEDPVPAINQIKSLTPILLFQSPEQKSHLIQDVIKINDGAARAEAIMELSRHLTHFSPEDRSLIINDAIKILADRGHPLTAHQRARFGADGYSIDVEGKREAAMAIEVARAGGHLTTEHEARIDLITSCWEPASFRLAEQRDRREVWLTRAATAQKRANANTPNSRPAGDRIKDLRQSLSRATSDTVRNQDLEEDPYGHGQMRALRETALSISAEANALSSELNERSRNRGGEHSL